MMKPFFKRRLYGIRLYEYALVLLGYFFFAYLYHLTLWINRLHNDPPLSNLYDPAVFMSWSGLPYLVKLLLTIPIWWLIFRKLKSVKLSTRLCLHVIGLPLFVLLYQQIYYTIAEALEWGHLTSYGQIWDIYIPTLIYILQFSVFHAYEYYHDNQRNLKLKAALSEAALKSELAALKAQLNPHFLYNVFNTISASVPPEQEKTREMIAELSDLFRYQLKASKSELVPLREELEFVKQYLDLEKARFEDRLRVIIDVPEEIRDILVPPMILQPLVENSVKHGISSLIDGGDIAIRVKKHGADIAFEVSDTGVGVTDKTKLFNAGLGLTNTKLRLEKKYGSELKISDNVPQGLKIEFTI